MRRLVALAGLAGVLGLAGWAWAASRLPPAYSAMEMGYVDGGGGPVALGQGGGHGGGHGAGLTAGRSLTSLAVDPGRPADATFTLVARQAAYDVPGGRRVEGFTVNGTSPGPELRVRQGQLVQVRLVNESVAGGTTLHWHGVDVPNSQDGVAGVTQDAVPVGGSHVYRFVAEDAGTFWYHSHQVSHDQVIRGLLGALIVEPAAGAASERDVVALLHSYAGQPTLNGRVADERVVAAAGERVRVRVINTDNVLTSLWASGGLLLAAVDGTEVHRPTEVRGQRVLVTAGARADLLVQAPVDGSAVRVHLGGTRSVVIGPANVEAPRVAQPGQTLDLLRYGSPAPLGFDPAQPDRRFDYVIGRRPGLIDGRPGMFWTINGRLYPDVPMYYVREGEVGRMRIENGSSEGHPMHLHGHHVLVLSRDGVPSTGSPWWADSLEVAAGESYEVAFVADNPGIWMDHCHNLPHAVEGMVAHLVYEGVSTPFLVNGPARNHPE